MMMFKSFLKECIFGISSVILLIDWCNGVLFHYGINMPISILMKVTLIILAFPLVLGKPKNILLFTTIFLYIGIVCMQKVIVGNALIFESLTLLIRVLYTIVMYIFFKNQILKNAIYTINRVKNIIFINWLIVVAAIFLGAIGYGEYSYATAFIGTKGYFIAGNELSGTFFILTSMVMYFSKSKTNLFFIIVTSILVSVLIASKVSLLSTIFAVLFVIKCKLIKLNALVKYLIFSIALIASSFTLYTVLAESDILTRWLFFYEKDGLGYLLFSGRLEFISNPLTDFKTFGLLDFIFGNPSISTVEMDFIDILMHFGVLGVLLFYSMIFYVVLKVFRSNSSFRTITLFIDVLLLIISSLAGHIIFSGLAGLFIALVNSLINSKENYYEKSSIGIK